MFQLAASLDCSQGHERKLRLQAKNRAANKPRLEPIVFRRFLYSGGTSPSESDRDTFATCFPDVSLSGNRPTGFSKVTSEHTPFAAFVNAVKGCSDYIQSS